MEIVLKRRLLQIYREFHGYIDLEVPEASKMTKNMPEYLKRTVQSIEKRKESFKLINGHKAIIFCTSQRASNV